MTISMMDLALAAPDRLPPAACMRAWRESALALASGSEKPPPAYLDPQEFVDALCAGDWYACVGQLRRAHLKALETNPEADNAPIDVNLDTAGKLWLVSFLGTGGWVPVMADIRLACHGPERTPICHFLGLRFEEPAIWGEPPAIDVPAVQADRLTAALTKGLLSCNRAERLGAPLLGWLAAQPAVQRLIDLIEPSMLKHHKEPRS